MRTILNLKQGETARILKTPDSLRLNELGFFEGEHIILLKASPLKQSCLIGIRGTTISIKKDTAGNVWIS